MIVSKISCLVISVLFVLAQHPVSAQLADENDTWWDKDVASKIAVAGDNAVQIQQALKQAAKEHRTAIEFVIKNLPDRDLQSATADRLLNNIRIAYAARAAMPWGKDIPEEVFLNDVLPDFNIDETREEWRAEFFEMCKPMVADCKTPGEAAQRLNERLFEKVGVKYSTKRKKANQSPGESIEQGLASCTGLSILLADACRSVCVPARLTGVPSWTNKRGNHTWVEVWDGRWHFTGAAEPNANGLNHTWFQGDAALADKTKRMNSIYAVSFKKTETTFPMVWSRKQGNRVYAVNVTDRYTTGKNQRPDDRVHTMIRLWNAGKSKRIIADVTVTCESGRCEKMTGKTRGGTADMNDMLEFRLPQNSKYKLSVGTGDDEKVFVFQTADKPQQLVEFIVK